MDFVFSKLINSGGPTTTRYPSTARVSSIPSKIEPIPEKKNKRNQGEINFKIIRSEALK